MPYTAQTRDLSKQYLGYDRDTDTFRPLAGATYTPGSVVQLVSQDLQVYTDAATVAPTRFGGAAPTTLVMGVVAETWVGFQGAIVPLSYLSPSSAAAVRGTVGVDIVLRGFHPAVLVDQSGAGAVTITNGITLVPAAVAIGYSQGIAATTAVAPLGATGQAMLPAAGIGSTLTAAALAQAADTSTVTGVPTVGDTYTVTIQGPYNPNTPGVVQTVSWTTPPLTAAQATTTTTAAAAIAAYLNTQPSYSQYFIASSAAAVVTTTVNALSNPFSIYYGSGSTVTGQLTVSVSGMVSNSLTYASSATGVSTFPATAGTLLGGTGYRGFVPAYVLPS